jgi:hypothetical protein
LTKIIHVFPTVAFVVGEKWLQQEQAWVEDYVPPRLVWYEQLENDLTLISEKIERQNLIRPYRSSLRDPNGTHQTMLEVHGAALLAAAASSIQLHVLRGDGNGQNFDILANIEGHTINAECKTRKDDFPFNLPRQQEGQTGITGYFGRRATVDPHDGETLGLPSRRAPDDVYSRETPESTTIRQIIADAQSQLPQSGINFILFGHIEGDREQLERALFGAEVLTIHKDLEKRKIVSTEWNLTPTGAFDAGRAGEPFRSISGVLWFRLYKAGNLVRSYELYRNPSATYPIPETVVAILERLMSEWTINLP